MEKAKTEFITQPDFSDVTPELLTEQKPPNPLYEKAFYSREEVNDSEYCQNTTTWD